MSDPIDNIDDEIDNEIESITYIQIVLMSLSVLIQILLLFKKFENLISPMILICIIFTSISFAIRVDKEKIKMGLFICLTVIIPIIFIINLPFKKLQPYQENIKNWTKIILICSIVLSFLLTILVGIQLNQDDIDENTNSDTNNN